MEEMRFFPGLLFYSNSGFFLPFLIIILGIGAAWIFCSWFWIDSEIKPFSSASSSVQKALAVTLLGPLEPWWSKDQEYHLTAR